MTVTSKTTGRKYTITANTYGTSNTIYMLSFGCVKLCICCGSGCHKSKTIEEGIAEADEICEKIGIEE